MNGLRAKGVTAASAVVIENASGDVLAYVGSPDVFDAENGGQNDGARAERQPGSTLKPFLYELAMEKLGFDPSTRLPDVELHLPVDGGADYAPRDYDGRFRGPVRLREALGSSLNVPAVWTVQQLGVDALLARLRELGFASLSRDADYYGPGLALGDGEVTLLELARAYATLARGGLDLPLRVVSRVEHAGASEVTSLAPDVARRVMPERFADLVTDVLKDHDAREGAFGERSVLDFPFEVAAKTGTSKGYRDNWTVGFARAVTVAVWVGNFDGKPMTNVSGITGAGPLFHALMEAAMQGRAREPLPITRPSRWPRARRGVLPLGRARDERVPAQARRVAAGGRGSRPMHHARESAGRPAERPSRGTGLRRGGRGRARVRAVPAGARLLGRCRGASDRAEGVVAELRGRGLRGPVTRRGDWGSPHRLPPPRRPLRHRSRASARTAAARREDRGTSAQPPGHARRGRRGRGQRRRPVRRVVGLAARGARARRRGERTAQRPGDGSRARVIAAATLLLN